ncbi:MAG: tetratricopeptide repeat protein [Acidimicrobiales bacterium]
MTTPTADERASYVEEAEYLRKSLDDLDRERSVGDVGESDYGRLRSEYLARANVIQRALASLAVVDEPAANLEASIGGGDRGATESTGRLRRLSTRRSRLITGWAGAGCFLVAAGLLAAALGGVWPFGSTPTLSVRARAEIMLAEASVLGNHGDLAQAVATYDRVLTLEPRQPVALANGGWLTRLAGLSDQRTAVVRNGDQEISAAVRVDPGYAVARAYDGVALFRDQHDAKAGAREFRAMLDDRPSPQLIRGVRNDAVAAFHAVGEAVPVQFVSSSKTT